MHRRMREANSATGKHLFWADRPVDTARPLALLRSVRTRPIQVNHLIVPLFLTSRDAISEGCGHRRNESGIRLTCWIPPSRYGGMEVKYPQSPAHGGPRPCSFQSDQGGFLLGNNETCTVLECVSRNLVLFPFFYRACIYPLAIFSARGSYAHEITAVPSRDLQYSRLQFLSKGVPFEGTPVPTARTISCFCLHHILLTSFQGLCFIALPRRGCIV